MNPRPTLTLVSWHLCPWLMCTLNLSNFLNHYMRWRSWLGAQVHDTHCLTILSSAVVRPRVTSATKNDAFIEKIKFQLIAYIIRQLGKTTMGPSNANSVSTAYRNTASCSNGNNSNLRYTNRWNGNKVRGNRKFSSSLLNRTISRVSEPHEKQHLSLEDLHAFKL